MLSMSCAHGSSFFSEKVRFSLMKCTLGSPPTAKLHPRASSHFAPEIGTKIRLLLKTILPPFSPVCALTFREDLELVERWKITAIGKLRAQ